MSRNFTPLFLTMALLVMGFTVLVFAEVPGTMNYQGRLTDAGGNPVADIPTNVTFKIYDEASAVLWEEGHVITPANGFFTVVLGSNGSPLNVDVFDHTECWLGITVGTDPEISPRTRLNSVPFAFKTGNVQSQDIINEPGVAAFSGAYYVYLLDSAYTVLSSLTITCPAAGYVLAVAHGRIATLPGHTTGVNSYTIVGISDEPTAVPANQDLDFQIPAAAPSGVYSIPFGMTSMFEVPEAGDYTYYYLAFEYSGSVTVADMQFNLVYFPTAYGSVDPVPDPVPVMAESSDGDSLIRLDVPVQIGNFDKLSETELSDNTVLEKELAALKIKVEELQRQIDIISRDH